MKKEEYYPLELKSVVLQNFLFSLDDKLFDMEQQIIFLQKELKEAEDKYNKEIMKQINNGHELMAHVLTATISTPKAETIGPVGAVVLATIMSMKPNKEIKEYITSIANTIDKKEDKDADISEG